MLEFVLRACMFDKLNYTLSSWIDINLWQIDGCFDVRMGGWGYSYLWSESNAKDNNFLRKTNSQVTQEFRSLYASKTRIRNWRWNSQTKYIKKKVFSHLPAQKCVGGLAWCEFNCCLSSPKSTKNSWEILTIEFSVLDFHSRNDTPCVGLCVFLRIWARAGHPRHWHSYSVLQTREPRKRSVKIPLNFMRRPSRAHLQLFF